MAAKTAAIADVLNVIDDAFKAGESASDYSALVDYVRVSKVTAGVTAQSVWIESVDQVEDVNLVDSVDWEVVFNVIPQTANIVSIDGWSCSDGFDPFADANGNLWVMDDLKGWFGDVPIRASAAERPLLDGDFDGPSTFAGRTVQISGTVLSADRNSLLYGMDSIAAVLSGTNRTGTLVVNESGRGVARVADDVRLAGPTLVKRIGPTSATFSLSLYSPNTARYSDTELQFDLTPATIGEGRTYNLTFNRTYGAMGSSGRLFVDNHGNAEYYPTIVFNGPCVNPTIQRVDDGRRLRLLMTLLDGQSVELDAANRTVTFGGASRRYLLSSDSRWFSLSPGLTELFYDTDSGDAHCTLTYRHAWN